MATAAAVAAHSQRGEEDEQGESQQDHQADRVVDPLLVFVRSEAPELIEELLDLVRPPVHDVQIQNQNQNGDSCFLIEVCLALVKFPLEACKVCEWVNVHIRQLETSR